MSEELKVDLLKRIYESLEEIKLLFLLTNQDKLMETKKKLLKERTIKFQIYNLCDGTRTTQDLAKLLNKSMEYINSYISILRREGLIRTVEREGKLVHEQIF